MNPPPVLSGLHHIRLPVGDVAAVRQWCEEVLGLECRLDYEEEEGVIGCLLAHPSGFTVGVHHAPEIAAALAGFPVLTLSVGDQASLADWISWLDATGSAHGPPCEGHVGLFVDASGPAGLTVRLHTTGLPAFDEA